MLNEKRQICSYAQGLARSLPASPYALVSRDILCHCHVQTGLTYVLKSIATCNVSQIPTIHNLANLAFWDYFHSMWNSTFSRDLTTTEPVFPIFLEDFSHDPASHFYKANTTTTPSNLKELVTLTTQNRNFLKDRKKLFSDQLGRLTPQLPRFQTTKSKSSFLFTVITHIYMCL